MNDFIYLPDAIEWKYGPVADVHGDEIVAWRHESIEQPTGLAGLVAEYRNARRGDDIRAERDRRIQAVMWRVERYESETRQGLAPTDDIAALDAYVQALRDLPGQDGFPWQGPEDEAVPWPEVP